MLHNHLCITYSMVDAHVKSMHAIHLLTLTTVELNATHTYSSRCQCGSREEVEVMRN